MLVYEKKVEGVRHLFGTEGNVPADTDVALTYKDGDGTTITLSETDTFLDDKAGGIVRKSDGKAVNVYIGNKNIIPGNLENLVEEQVAAQADEPADEPELQSLATEDPVNDEEVEEAEAEDNRG